MLHDQHRVNDPAKQLYGFNLIPKNQWFAFTTARWHAGRGARGLSRGSPRHADGSLPRPAK